jgi:hypothetical protein
MDELQRQVIALLGEQPLFPHVIAKTINADKDALAVLLRQLLEEEVVSMNNGLIQLNLKQ